MRFAAFGVVLSPHAVCSPVAQLPARDDAAEEDSGREGEGKREGAGSKMQWE